MGPPLPPPGMPALPAPVGVLPVFQIPHSPEFIPHPGLPPLEARMMQLQRAGMDQAEINRQLVQEGYPATNVLEHVQTQQFAPMTQPTFQGMMPPPPPPPPQYEPASGKEDVITLLTEDIQEISEAIIAEKWGKAKKDIDEMLRWKDDADSKLGAIQDQMKALEAKMDSLEKAIFGKVEDYSRGISDVNAELKAMQRVFSTVMPTFTANIKELQGLVEGTKEKKKAKK